MENLSTLQFLIPTKEFRKLHILLTIHKHPHSSQHKIASLVDLSSAMVNSYVKELAAQGYLELSNRNRRDLNYFLTPAGGEKLTSLVMGYSAEIVQLYSGAKREICQRLNEILNEKKHTDIVLYGASDTCELVLQSLHHFPDAHVVGIVDGMAEKQNKSMRNHKVLAPTAIPTFKPDMVIITSFAKQDEIYDHIAHLEKEGIKIRKLTTIPGQARP